jgi:nitroimidazol reductase NimA-like FMN-containing flavoprotein (pyridoxamine 5'-phosphate oxidase superfamily)
MDAEGPVRELSQQECWDRVATAPYGRLAMSVFDDVDIVPVNAVLSRGDLYFRTAPGSKLAEIAANPRVAFEVDGYDDDTAFSVVVKGTAERLEHHAEIDAAEDLPLTPWIPTLKYRWVRIHPESVTGRTFRRGPEPDRFV